MRYISGVILLFLATATKLYAQDELFGNLVEGKPVRNGFIIGANGNFDIPGGDMGNRFGSSYRVGPSLLYKTLNNWMFGAKADFLFGNRVKEDSLMINIRTSEGAFIDKGGLLRNAGLFERGYMVGLQGGKIFNFGRQKSDNGLFLMTGVGFMQHRIRIVDKNNDIHQISGDYKKGYDRLTNGWYAEQFVGYNHFSDNALINFHIGLNITAGFTEGRRSFLYDVMRPDTGSRLDLLYGIRGGWYIPMFRKKSEDLYF